MSVLIEFAMFPTDKGVSVSEDVSRVIEMIRRDYPRYKLTAMGTIVETEKLAEALEVIEKAYGVLEPYSERVYSSIKIDIRKSKDDRLEAKVASIKDKIGLVNV